MKKLCTLFVFVLIAASVFAQNGKKPVIGISSTMGDGTNTSTQLTYVNSVIRAGGVPVVLPITEDPELIAGMLERVDGIIMTGGEDVDPLKWFGEEPVPAQGEIAPKRDAFDVMLIRMAVAKGLPVLGICRGEQLMNVAFGGSLYQDLPSQLNGYAIKHSQKAPGWYGTHSIQIEKGSLLNKQINLDTVVVNTFHHQGVKDIAPGFRVTARSKDGVVEAIEKIGSTRVFGVQFHPEVFTSNGIDTFLGIFKHLVEEAKKK
ncbi:MAG TPA: gamma-glutamyl-gamma-aminobutyrate hydrolase family protein [Bacteroidales bacterium]|nr:gamma-glutamyl-gamma-aminobutyrate hydrolase family protein [Bacteroidales bacterium]HNW48076.1 gamma-glutamyl-gamma-aminobutyrate hydrolase family protein [Bacteroidales bacterium]HPS96180.1 gamma-glutamyl-gamma-aminobutyrate hydrolase family protein [Bacteroidales bacterium]